MSERMAEQFPVTVAVSRPDGSVEQVRVGTATRTDEGFSLQLGQLSIGSQPVAAQRASPSGSYSASRPSGGGGGGGAGGMVFPPYGRSKGMPISGASMQDLEFYANGARRTLNDPGKARFHDKERALLATIEAEIARQGGGGGGDDGPPPHTDEDQPF